MADPTIPPANSATGTSSVATTTATFGFTATAGRLLVLVVGSDDYKTGNPSGWTLSTGCSQETYLGHYLFWKIAAGTETNVQYTIGSASKSAWIVLEFDNIDSTPLDTSNGQNVIGGTNSYTTPAITPSTGRRMVLASVGGATGTGDWTGVATWLNSYTEIGESFHSGSGTRDIVGVAVLLFDGDSSTTTSSGATFSPYAPDAKTSIIIAFKVGTFTPRLLTLGVG